MTPFDRDDFAEPVGPNHRPASPSARGKTRSGDAMSSAAQSIPIRVVHERSNSPSAAASSPGRSSKQHYNTRNTTELPARASPQPESPRLERAHSEPPKSFQQRLFQQRPHNNHYTSIPEAGSSPQQTSGLNVPPNLSTSASAPHVPHNNNNNKHPEEPPVPPPRRPSPIDS